MATRNPKRTFDWVPSFDPNSKNYAISSKIRSTPKRVDILWEIGPILDQGSEGACVGFGWTAQTLASPFKSDLRRSKSPKSPREPQPFAMHVYREAQKVDQWPGEDYSGTSVLAGAKIMKNLGFMSSYAWAFSIDEIIDSILAKGPVVLGIPWYSGMYKAPNGVLKVSGKKVGGHCIVAVGFKVSSDKFGGGSSVILQNSWGNDWGINGLAEIEVSELEKLIANSAEACIPLKTPYRNPLSLRRLFFRVKSSLRRLAEKVSELKKEL
jgi:hypothetical protein